ncbi:MAG: methyltransferase, partial [Methanoregulaceae archaeon]|nr:methyltransferase [Methanoregulaceae archaeon]
MELERTGREPLVIPVHAYYVVAGIDGSVVTDREQWCVRVPRQKGEEVRMELAGTGLLDPSLRPRTEGDEILFPVTSPSAGDCRASFQPHPGRPELPPHELVGGIAIMQEDERKSAVLLLESRPSIHTVLFAESDVEGVYRTRRFRVLAGDPTTITDVTEYGHRFRIDLSAAYFSARLSTERQRVLEAVTPGERVLDMFTGVGPFAIVLSHKASLVVAADINPAAIHLLLDNLRRNRVRNVLPMLADAARLGSFPWKFDRVVMNLPHNSADFLGTAYSLCREGGTIHLYTIQEREGEFLEVIRSGPAGEVSERPV